VSSFIGREAELAAVRALVGRWRLVTLTGAGGAGKTRLGLQVAAGLADGTGDGVWFADLAPLGDPDLVAVTVADEPGASLPLIESGLGVARRLREPQLTGRLLAVRSYAAYVAGDHAGAARDAAAAAPLLGQAVDRLQVGVLLGNLGYLELSAGDLDEARRHLAESLDIARAFDDRYGIVYGTFHLGLAEYLGASPGAAEALFAESFELARCAGMKRSTATRCSAWRWSAVAGPIRAGRPGCTARPTRPSRIWTTPSSRWKAAWPTWTASGCAPRWATRPSKPNTPRAAPSARRRCWRRSAARTQGPGRRACLTRLGQGCSRTARGRW
jgi:hypothetical protein